MIGTACRRSRPYLARLLVAAGVVLAPLGSAAFGALECYPEPPVNRTGHWSWRNVDGKRCWYPGRPGIDRANLRWTQSSPPTLARGGDEQQPSQAAAQRHPRMPEAAPAGGEEALLESVWPPLEPASFSERWPQ